jgi:hypothetical protein
MKRGEKAMRKKPGTKIEDIDRDNWMREHYDVYSLELMEKQVKAWQIYQLVEALVDNCLELAKQVVELRRQVNRLTPSGQPQPFLDELYSDLYESFNDYAAYPKFKRILKRLE